MQLSSNENARKKILNVDDSETKRYVTSRTLRNAGFDVVEAATGQDCLEMVISEHPDLIVLDVLLPDLHGFEVCHRLKSDSRTKSIPVLHLSASFTRPEDRVKGFDQGADAYMSQPVDPSEFVATIKSLLRMVEAERQLRDSQERFDLAQQKVSLGSWEWNIATDTIAWSNSLVNLHGIEDSSIFPSFEQWLQLVHQDDRGRVQSAITKALSGEKDYDVEFRTLRPDGSAQWIAARAALFRDESGRPVRMLGISLDVTSRKRAEEAIKETQRLVGAGRMAASVAHEINNPLAAVVNIIYLLRDNKSLDADAARLVEWADRELSRVAYIVSQTLGFYRQSDRPVSVSVREAVLDVFELLKKKLQEGSIAAYTSFKCEGIIHGHSTEIRQVVSNLVINALEALPPNGKLFVRVTPSRNWKHNGERGVRLYVHDNGSGIPTSARSQIFEPFFSTKSNKGTGLGLWVIRSIVEKYGGSIRMRSSVGKDGGTSFSVFLPTTRGLEQQNKKCWSKVA
jgi:two-component system, NtrC family, sensor kinase